MINKTIFKGIRELQIFKAAPLALLLLKGNTVLAQTAKPTSNTSDYSPTTIILCVVGIIVIILVSWMIGSRQSKPDSHPEIHTPSNNHRRHFDHPNDPHFRKIKRKTS
jgi:hypothetical protein